MTRLDLDWLAAQTAQDIIKNTTDGQDPDDVDNLLTKALGILQENGVYAAFLYLYSRTRDKERLIAEQTKRALLDTTPKLGLTPPPDISTAAPVLDFLTKKVCQDLDTLLLFKQLWEQTLIYARYGAKACSVEKKVREEAARKAQEETEKAQAQS